MQTYLKDTTTKKCIRIEDALYTLGHSSIAEKKYIYIKCIMKYEAFSSVRTGAVRSAVNTVVFFDPAVFYTLYRKRRHDLVKIFGVCGYPNKFLYYVF